MESKLRTEAFMEHAMETWGALVYQLALNQTHAPHDADDVSQEVFLRLLKDTTDFVDDEHMKAWLICVTVNRCRELHRSAWKRRVSATDIASPVFANLEAPVQTLFQSDIGEALGRLPANMRLIVHLHYVEGYSLEEIARLVRCKPATVRSRLHRARKQLKLDLEQEVDYENIETECLSLAH